MRYKISKLETKSPDWKKVWGVGGDGTDLIDASVNRTGKDGTVFPNFDGIVENSEVEGNFWSNDAGKQYLFPPKPVAQNTSFKGGRGAGIKEAQERKSEYIKEAQERKDNSIAFFNATNNAIVLAGVMWKDMPDVDPKAFIQEWRDWFLSEWDGFNRELPS